MMPPLTIGITDCSKYGTYQNWIQQYHALLRIIKLGVAGGNGKDAERCDGILLTGGEDVHPRFYHKPEYLSFCFADDVNEQRDEFELQLIGFTQQHAVPLLGICRGLQIANVYFGGTLIPDLPSWGKEGHAKRSDGTDGIHAIQTTKGFLRSDPAELYEVNSNHHQAIERVADELVVTAYSTDGVIEAVERKEGGRAYLQLVQWHPERMENQNSIMSKDLLSAFINASIGYAKRKG